jgi:hypothetical protein
MLPIHIHILIYTTHDPIQALAYYGCPRFDMRLDDSSISVLPTVDGGITLLLVVRSIYMFIYPC